MLFRSGLVLAPVARVDIYYENDTRYRGQDKTGHRVGLSKFRNTLQIEADKKVGDGWAVRSILRGTWDGVYRLNKDEYGEDAGSKSAADVRIPNTAGPVAQSVGLFGPAGSNPLGSRSGGTSPTPSSRAYPVAATWISSSQPTTSPIGSMSCWA